MAETLFGSLGIQFPAVDWSLSPELQARLKMTCLNVMVFGWVASAKSSYLNTLLSAFKWSKQQIEQVFKTGAKETAKMSHVTKKLRGYADFRIGGITHCSQGASLSEYQDRRLCRSI